MLSLSYGQHQNFPFELCPHSVLIPVTTLVCYVSSSKTIQLGLHMPELAPWNQLFHFIKHMACKNSICLLMKRLLVVTLPGEHSSGIKTKSNKSMILHPLLSCISLRAWNSSGALKCEMKSLRPPIPSTFLLLALNTCLVRQLLPHLPQVFTALLVGSDATHSQHLTHHHCPS